jgi:hypothetical protein
MMFEEMLETAEHSAGDLLDEAAAGDIKTRVRNGSKILLLKRCCPSSALRARPMIRFRNVATPISWRRNSMTFAFCEPGWEKDPF